MHWFISIIANRQDLMNGAFVTRSGNAHRDWKIDRDKDRMIHGRLSWYKNRGVGNTTEQD